MRRYLIILGIVIACGAFIFFLKKPAYAPGNENVSSSAEIADKKIFVDIVDTDAERVRGLSGRAILAENAGMLFIFEREDTYSFWMKDMNFPIDILWIDKDFVVQDITKNAEPRSFPTIFKPRIPVQYVLEVNAGFSEENKIEIGKKISIPSLQ